MNQERLLNHADAEQIATAIERMADIPRGQNDGDIGELPSHADGMRLLNGLNKFNEKLTADLDSKVDKEEGKGLSTNDYTNEEKAKLEGIEAGAEVNIQADWEQSTDSADDFIKNKPSLGTAAAKDYTTTASDGSTDLIESGAVYSGLALKIDTTEKGSANGVAELDANGFVPSAQLPSFVDDILEYANTSAFPATGETGKIYVALDTNRTYRWSGSAYVEVSESLALGETSSTAYAGNKGKANADAISAIKDGSTIDSFADVETALSDKVDKVAGKGLSENDFTSTLKTKLDNIESGAQVNTVTGIKGDNESTYRTGNVNITKDNIGLGNVGNFKAVSTAASQGLSDTEKANARANIGAGSSTFSGDYNDLTNKPTLGTASALDVPASGNASSSQVVKGDDSRLSDARPASDVSSWAKQTTKPSYSANEVGALPDTTLYAGSASAGGAASSLANFENNNSSGKNANDVTYNAHTYYTSNGPETSLGATTTDGALFSQAYSSSWVAQIAQDYRNGNLFTRGKNNGTWQPWKRVVYSDEIGDGFEACTTTFSADGKTITQQYSNKQVVTTFNANGTITEQLKNAAGTSVIKTKTTTFNSDGSISETVS